MARSWVYDLLCLWHYEISQFWQNSCFVRSVSTSIYKITECGVFQFRSFSVFLHLLFSEIFRILGHDRNRFAPDVPSTRIRKTTICEKLNIVHIICRRECIKRGCRNHEIMVCLNSGFHELGVARVTCDSAEFPTHLHRDRIPEKSATH